VLLLRHAVLTIFYYHGLYGYVVDCKNTESIVVLCSPCIWCGCDMRDLLSVVSIFYSEVTANYHYWLVPTGRRYIFTLFCSLPLYISNLESTP
jgi:hypothetical protein